MDATKSEQEQISFCKNHGETLHVPDSTGYLRCRKCRTFNTSERRRERKKKAVEYKGGDCYDCGLVSPFPSVYDFHHRDPSTKLFEISRRSHSAPWEEIVDELDKCDMLCANCHRIRHEKEHRLNENL